MEAVAVATRTEPVESASPRAANESSARGAFSAFAELLAALDAGGEALAEPTAEGTTPAQPAEEAPADAEIACPAIAACDAAPLDAIPVDAGAEAEGESEEIDGAIGATTDDEESDDADASSEAAAASAPAPTPPAPAPAEVSIAESLAASAGAAAEPHAQTAAQDGGGEGADAQRGDSHAAPAARAERPAPAEPAAEPGVEPAPAETGDVAAAARADDERAEARDAFQPFAREPVAPPETGTLGRADAAAPAAQRPVTEAPARELRVLPELPASNEHDLLERAHVLARENGGQARIRLVPPQLGDLDLRVIVTERAVQVTLAAERPQVAELLLRHLPELRQSLQAQGLEVDRIHVDVSGGDDATAFRDGEARGEHTWHEPGQGAGSRPAEDAWLPARAVALPRGALGAVDVHV
jgi:flagellar hook-length control protein FliK